MADDFLGEPYSGSFGLWRGGQGVGGWVAVPEVRPAVARARGELVGEMAGAADHLCIQERPPGRTEHAEGMF